MRKEASSSISTASAPSFTNTGNAAMEDATESKRTNPIVFNGGSSMVSKTTSEKKANVPSAPTIKWAKISKGWLWSMNAFSEYPKVFLILYLWRIFSVNIG